MAGLCCERPSLANQYNLPDRRCKSVQQPAPSWLRKAKYPDSRARFAGCLKRIDRCLHRRNLPQQTYKMLTFALLEMPRPSWTDSQMECPEIGRASCRER